MKKKFLIGSILPALVGTAIVGTGFSLWFFNDTSVATEPETLNKNVTQLVEIGTITKANDFTMVFDQETRDSNLANADLAMDGIHLDFGSGTNKVAKYNKPTDAGTVDIIENSTKVVFKTTIKFTNGLADYVKIAYNNGESKNFTFATDSFSYELTFDSTTTAENMVFNWEKVTFSYAKDKEPTNKTDYASFKTLVEGSTINVTYTATLVGAKASA